MNLVILSLTSTGEFVENREEESQIFFFKVESFLYNFLFCSKSFQPPKKSDTKRIEHYQTNLYIPGWLEVHCPKNCTQIEYNIIRSLSIYQDELRYTVPKIHTKRIRHYQNNLYIPRWLEVHCPENPTQNKILYIDLYTRMTRGTLSQKIRVGHPFFS